MHERATLGAGTRTTTIVGHDIDWANPSNHTSAATQSQEAEPREEDTPGGDGLTSSAAVQAMTASTGEMETIDSSGEAALAIYYGGEGPIGTAVNALECTGPSEVGCCGAALPTGDCGYRGAGVAQYSLAEGSSCNTSSVGVTVMHEIGHSMGLSHDLFGFMRSPGANTADLCAMNLGQYQHALDDEFCSREAGFLYTGGSCGGCNAVPACD